MTITLPDDDLVLAPPYMELSEGEDEEDEVEVDSKSCPLTANVKIHRKYSEPITSCSASEVKGQEVELQRKSTSFDVERIPVFDFDPSDDSGHFDNCDCFTNNSQANPCPANGCVISSADVNTTSGCGLTEETSQGADGVTQVNPASVCHQTEVIDCPETKGSSINNSHLDSPPADDSSRDASCEPANSTSLTSSSLTMPTIHERSKTSNGASAIDAGPTCTCDFRRRSWDHVADPDGKALLQILELPSRVFATRQPVELEILYPKCKRVVLRDVLRTDRNFHYFRSEAYHGQPRQLPHK